MNFFVMVNHPSEDIPAAALMEDIEEGIIAFFPSYEDAEEAAMSDDFASSYGWEIFQLGCGE